MQISDIEKLYGITEGTVKKLLKKSEGKRFLSPTKNASGNYDYGNAEIRWLKRYKVLMAAGLKYEQVVSMERGELTLAEALMDRVDTHKARISEAQNSLDFCDLLMREGSDYADMPIDDLFEEYQRRIREGAIFVDDQIPDTSPISLERDFYCPHCGKRFTVDFADYVVGEWREDRPMDVGVNYTINTEECFQCPNCDTRLDFKGTITEYPAGAYDTQDIELKTVFDVY